MGWGGVGWRGVGWTGVEWCKVDAPVFPPASAAPLDLSAVEWSGVGWRAVEWGGVGWSAVEWNGVGRGGEGWGGVEWPFSPLGWSFSDTGTFLAWGRVGWAGEGWGAHHIPASHVVLLIGVQFSKTHLERRFTVCCLPQCFRVLNGFRKALPSRKHLSYMKDQ